MEIICKRPLKVLSFKLQEFSIFYRLKLSKSSLKNKILKAIVDKWGLGTSVSRFFFRKISNRAPCAFQLPHTLLNVPRTKGCFGCQNIYLFGNFFNLLGFFWEKNPKTPPKIFPSIQKKFEIPPQKKFWISLCPTLLRGRSHIT